MKRNIFVRILAILLAAAMIFGCGYYLVLMISPASVNTYAMSADDREKFNDIEQLMEFIKDNYRDKVDDRTLIEGAYAGILGSLDPWSVYYSSSDEMEEFTSSLDNENYAGVGCTITSMYGKIYVSALNKRGPAYRYGLKCGDNIIAVDGVKVDGSDTSSVANKLRGEIGTTVKVTVLRQGKKVDLTLVRKTLSKNSVSTLFYDRTTGKPLTSVDQIDTLRSKLAAVISIEQFNENTSNEFERQLVFLQAMGIKKIVIDLRDNGGGYMEEALACASNFLKAGDLLTSYVHQGDVIDEEYVKEDGKFNFDVALVVNAESASASEAFTMIMKDYGLAKIVGTKTFGKGVAQRIFSLGDGSFMKLTTEYFTGPKREIIQDKGIEPDYLVECDNKSLLEIRIDGLEDLQIKKALELLK